MGLKNDVKSTDMRSEETHECTEEQFETLRPPQGAALELIMERHEGAQVGLDPEAKLKIPLIWSLGCSLKYLSLSAPCPHDNGQIKHAEALALKDVW